MMEEETPDSADALSGVILVREIEAMDRRTLREHLFKLLFRIEFNPEEDMPEQVRMYIEGIKELSPKDEAFLERRYGEVEKNLAAIDEKIKVVARGWTVERMGKVDLTLLRLAVYEILYDPDIPAGVAINEAVELAKSFGQDSSGSFVNGVLAKVVR